MTAPDLEPWRLRFREELVENIDQVPPEQRGSLREMTTFAEAVAVDVAPVLREAGFDDTEQQAELYAVFRVAGLFASAHEAAAEHHLALAEGRAPNAARVGELMSQFTTGFDSLFYGPMLKHSGIFSSPTERFALEHMLELVRRKDGM